MKVLLWIGDQANQKALAHKIDNEFKLVGIIVEKKMGSNSSPSLLDVLLDRTLFRSIRSSWKSMISKYSSLFPQYPNVPILEIENINSEEVQSFSRRFETDIIAVSGTRLINSQTLNAVKDIRVLNLHTGLSPYVKGGPNCTNWCIARNQLQFIGNTVLWIDEGIDSGHILASEFVTIKLGMTLKELHFRVMEDAHDLYIRAIKYLEAGNQNRAVQSSIAEGKTYYSKDWNKAEKKKLLRNIKLLSKKETIEEIERLRKGIKVIELH